MKTLKLSVLILAVSLSAFGARTKNTGPTTEVKTEFYNTDFEFSGLILYTTTPDVGMYRVTVYENSVGSAECTVEISWTDAVGPQSAEVTRVGSSPLQATMPVYPLANTDILLSTSGCYVAPDTYALDLTVEKL